MAVGVLQYQTGAAHLSGAHNERALGSLGELQLARLEYNRLHWNHARFAAKFSPHDRSDRFLYLGWRRTAAVTDLVDNGIPEYGAAREG
jgi:hypothetical protein